MARGRKADKGTYEAREKIILICNKISMIKELSNDAQERVIKALKFGLGIKEEEKIIVQEEKEIVTPIKEKTVTKKENPIIEKFKTVIKEKIATERGDIKEKKTIKKENLDNQEGDEYFKPEDYKEAGY